MKRGNEGVFFQLSREPPTERPDEKLISIDMLVSIEISELNGWKTWPKKLPAVFYSASIENVKSFDC